MSKVSFELMNIVRAFTAATGVLAVDGVDTEASRSHTEDERVLYVGARSVLRNENMVS